MEGDSPTEPPPAQIRPIFISDASVEADKLRTRLENAGYLTVEVPVGLLASRAVAQPPSLVVLDGEGSFVLEVIGQLSRPPILSCPVVVLGGDRNAVPPGVTFLARPIDLASTLALVTALAGPAPDDHARRRARAEQAEGHAARERRPSALPPPIEAAPFADAVGPAVEHAEFSAGLVELLRRAEEKIPRYVQDASLGARPSAAAEHLVGEHLLVALDGLLDATESPEEPRQSVTDDEAAHPGREKKSDHPRPSSLGQDSWTPARAPQGSVSTRPPPVDDENTSDNLTGAERGYPASATALPTVRENSIPRPPESHQSQRAAVSSTSSTPVRVHLQHFTSLCERVAERFTGCVVVESAAGLRRIVLRDGDFSGVASTVREESLQRFLVLMNRLDVSAASELELKLPTYGRHAGAGLVAHGVISSDELWPTLREHSEWLLRRALAEQAGRLSAEITIPERLAGEPAVFGGATGAEVLVALAQEALPEEELAGWVRHLDGTLVTGARGHLLGECALADPLLRYLEMSLNTPLHDVIAQGPTPGFSRVLYALIHLGALATHDSVNAESGQNFSDAPPETLRPARTPIAATPVARTPSTAAPRSSSSLRPTLPPGRTVEPQESRQTPVLSRRELILSRKALVEEGDYFAVLDVGRNANDEEVASAYQRLKELFELSHVLTPETADLEEDVMDILEVLREAYTVLRHPERRALYRVAIAE